MGVNMNKLFNLKICILLLLLVVISGLLGSALTAYHLDATERNKETVVKLIDEVWSKGDLQIAGQLIAPQYTIRHDPGDPWEGKTIDLSTFKKRVELSRHIFPDQKFHIEDMVCEGNKVAVSWVFTGTQKTNLPGLPATNKMVSASGITIYYFSKGKIIGHWQVFDKLGLLDQLGAKIGEARINKRLTPH